MLFSEAMKRVLGLDWGEKRIGVALSDPLGLTSQGVGVITRRKDAGEFAEIAALVAEKAAEGVIVGVPYSDDGTENASTKKALAFAAELRAKLSVPVEISDESYTSDEANRILKSRGVSWKDSKAQVDRVAAAVMLQAWLDSRPSQKVEDLEEEA